MTPFTDTLTKQLSNATIMDGSGETLCSALTLIGGGKSMTLITQLLTRLMELRERC